MSERSGIESVIAAFRGRNPAPASLEAFAEDCLGLARRDSRNAGFYLMLSLHARALAEGSEGAPLTADVALEAKNRIIVQAERVASALELGPGAKLALLNDLAHARASGR